MKTSKWIWVAILLAAPGAAQAKPVDLFGIPLATATRATLEPALVHAGLTPIQVGNQWWFDQYAVHGQLPGAKKLLVGYTEQNHFAIAEYVFPSFMDIGQVVQIIRMVEGKYGPPSQQSGNPGLGDVQATWNEGDGMIIRVSRGWPSTTTYLSLENVASDQRMKAQMQQQKRQQESQQAKAHSNAF
ncbi:MAG: hypothetical protein JJ693_08830 [Acidithiobacillus sp.]|nr:hypothetical protein [Acidithiobacillus sp.]